MILQALYNYYHRLLKEHPAIPQFGFAQQKVHFSIVIKPNGALAQVKDIRDTRDKKMVPTTLITPALASKRTSGICPQFLCDKCSYVLGVDGGDKPDRTAKEHVAFKNLHTQIAQSCDDAGLHALCEFLNKWNPDDFSSLPHDPYDLLQATFVFQLEGQNEYLHQRPALQQAWVAHLQSQQSSAQAICLVTGHRQPVAELHLPIKNLRGAQSSGASLCSFNLSSFCSYNKSQNHNAPMSPEAAFAYVTALNHLLRNESRQATRIADTTVAFWTERASPAEGFLGILLNPTDDPSDLQNIRTILDAVRAGQWPAEIDPNVSVYVLGLAPNAARIAVRFWLVNSLEHFAARVAQHFLDLAICRKLKTDPEYPSLWHLSLETAAQHKEDNIPPLLFGAVLRAILTGAEYPLSFYSAILNRIRADHTINYVRAAALKAFLVRHYRINQQPKEVPMSLDPNNKNPGYLLGRLFALLEKAQLDALGKVDATIKDRYYGAASSTPRAVFPVLLRLAQHHLAKAEYGAVRDKEIQTVVNDLQEFPAHLSLEEQGLSAIGYYHQRHAFYNKPTE